MLVVLVDDNLITEIARGVEHVEELLDDGYGTRLLP